MKFTDLKSSEQILEFFESAPINDFNLLYKFHLTYIYITKALSEAFSGYAYQRDLYDVYIQFYAKKPCNYSMFSRILSEMKEANLIDSTDNSPKIVYLKAKSYQLMGKNQSTVHHSRMNNLAMEKATWLSKLHLVIKSKISNYHPSQLKQDKKNPYLYHIVLRENAFYSFLLCVKERQSSKSLVSEIVKSLDFFNEHTYGKPQAQLRLHLVSDSGSKILDKAIERLQSIRDFAGRKQVKVLKMNLENKKNRT